MDYRWLKTAFKNENSWDSPIVDAISFNAMKIGLNRPYVDLSLYWNATFNGITIQLQVVI